MGERLEWTPARRPDRTPLRGSHVLLRPLDGPADAVPLFEASRDPAIWTYLFDGPYQSADQLRGALELAQVSEDPFVYALARLPGERPEGIASYLRITPEHGVIEIGGIWFGTPMQRTTAATETIYLLARNAFDELGYRRLEWKCDSHNAASRRAAVRFGFAFEGIFEQHMVIKGRNRDTAWFAITDKRWPAIRAAFETWLDPANFDADGRQRRSLGDLTREGAA